MKILIISTSESGGAYVSAERLANGFKDIGNDVVLLTRSSYQMIKRKKIMSFTSKVITLLSKLLARKPFEQIAPVSVPFLTLKDIEDINPDLVHIHNWYNFLSVTQIEQIIRRYPVVFTMHDVRLLTGGCFFTFDCDGVSNGCKDCPAIFFPKLLVRSSRIKITKMINMSKPYKVITPSNWMQKQFQLAYPETPATVLQVIPNMPYQNNINLNSKFRKTLGSRKNLLFVASDINQPLKGLSLLLEAMIMFRDSAHLTVVGSGKINLSPESQKYITVRGSLTRAELQEQFDVCDALIVPSFSENRPNIVIEAQLSGLFVLASDVGGIPEMILEGQTGILFRPRVEELIRAIDKYLKMTEETKQDISERAFGRVNADNNPVKIIEAHIKIYTELLNEYRQGDSGGRQE